MRVAPASSAFSTSSLTTLAGRSTTSPAAMRLTVVSESWRTGICGLIRMRLESTGAIWRLRERWPKCPRYFAFLAEPFGRLRDQRGHEHPCRRHRPPVPAIYGGIYAVRAGQRVDSGRAAVDPAH